MFNKPQLALGLPFEKFDAGEEDAWTGHVVEPKYDGMRALMHLEDDGKTVNIYSRSGKLQNGKCPHIERWMVDNLPAGTILDGEFAIVDHWVDVAGQQVPIVDFNKTMRVMGSSAAKAIAKQKATDEYVSVIAFDIVKFDGIDLAEAPDWERRETLMGAFISDEPVFITPRFHDTEDFVEVYDTITDVRGEGVILKNTAAVYEYGKRPRGAWYKVKAASTFDVVVTGFTNANEGVTGKFLGQIGAIEFSAYDPEGNLKYVGRCSGMNDALRRKWTDIRDSGTYLDAAGKPIHVIEVKANELVGSGEYRTPRHPQYITLRVDKTPAECLLEQFKVA